MNSKQIKDFNLYARDKGISSLTLDYYNKNIENSLTPYILEERQMNVTVMDVFSRLMMDRIIFLGDAIYDNIATTSFERISKTTIHIDNKNFFSNKFNTIVQTFR